jgi:hypothetical protein
MTFSTYIGYTTSSKRSTYSSTDTTRNNAAAEKLGYSL